MPRVDRLVIHLGIPALALLVGLGLPVVARWLLDLSPGLPFRPVFRFAGAVDRPWEIAVNLVIWLGLGLGAARSAASEAAVITVDGAEVRLGGGERGVPRAEVAAVFLDGRKLVVLDHESRQRVRETVPVSAGEAARAFREHGYPWRDADPYADRFRTWVPGAPQLPSTVDTVLAAREAALKRKAHGEVRSLGEAVQRLGYVVREEGNRQYWRPLVSV